MEGKRCLWYGFWKQPDVGTQCWFPTHCQQIWYFQTLIELTENEVPITLSSLIKTVYNESENALKFIEDGNVRYYGMTTKGYAYCLLSFDLGEVLLETELGMLQIKGRDLHVNRLNLEKGEADIDGEISAMIYSEVPGSLGKSSGLLGKIFR